MAELLPPPRTVPVSGGATLRRLPGATASTTVA